MLKYLQIVFQNIFDIFKIYLKFAILTLCLYFVAEWYIMRYGIDLNDNKAPPLLPQLAENSTVYKIYQLAMDFLFR